MTGVTPVGLISFISRAYGGKASDMMIYLHKIFKYSQKLCI